MALTQSAPIATIVNLDPVGKTFSIELTSVIYKDGVELTRTSERKYFSPGELDEVKAYINETSGPLIDYITYLWC